MRILFDQGTPAPLRRALTGHIVSTAYEMSWTKLDNGAVLDAAELHFDVLITTDRNLRYQQNVSGRKLAIMVLLTTSWPKIKRAPIPHYQRCRRAPFGRFRGAELLEQDS
jgi:hypothetical protein